MHYTEFLNELKELADENYRDFHKKLLKNDNICVLGVRVPQMRKVAKKYRSEIDDLMSFPDEYYEVTFIKLTAVSLLPYESFIKYVDSCVPLIDNWATCDCFAAKCIDKHKEEFLPYIEKYLNSDGEFYQRFALVTLLHFYVEPEYAELIFNAVQGCNTQLYYVHMGAAWLIAEALIKFYDKTVDFLNKNSLDKKTHNKAIQKACESYRLTAEQKTYLKGIKI